MRLSSLFLTIGIIMFSWRASAQNQISISSAYAVEELSSNEDYEYAYNFHVYYSKTMKPWFNLNMGLYYQQQSFISGGAPWFGGDVVVQGELLNNVARNIHAQGKAKTILATTGFQFSKYGFSSEVFGGIGSSSLTSTWYYRTTHNGLDLNRHSFEEEYERKFTWMYGVKLAYTYPLSERINIGVSLSGSLLDSFERKVSSTSGEYKPEEYYNPELSKNSSENYGDKYIFAGLFFEFKI